ncbi:hypothetical protein CDL12_21359 [Handroanthus impetiginosus]|uniref:DUF7887 domain-containing protein n=1 Tax=Handroanthus impetiginosus TaxID=429701 RepID=A0A2G9GLF8_9LAMI|nr:hypothetical protein CDL12_21359 [Handroanthus impetiginosus]
MFITDGRLICCNTFSCLISNKNGTKPLVTLAKKKDFSEISSTANRTLSPLKLPNKLLIQSAIGVFALGFIDAGYSGDWSRIGVISRETEDLLKAAACLVVPLCLFLIFSLLKKDNEE